MISGLGSELGFVLVKRNTETENLRGPLFGVFDVIGREEEEETLKLNMAGKSRSKGHLI